MLLESFACLRLCVWKSAFKAAGHGVLCNGANQIVVRNSQGPLRTAERREELMGGGGGWGALSHDDIVKQIWPGLPIAAHTFVSGHSLSCLAILQNPLRVVETRQQWVISWYDCKVWYESVWEFRGWVQLTRYIWEDGDSSSSISKIK